MLIICSNIRICRHGVFCLADGVIEWKHTLNAKSLCFQSLSQCPTAIYDLTILMNGSNATCHKLSQCRHKAPKDIRSD